MNDMFRELLRVELVPFKELEAVVRGLIFTRTTGAPRELFSTDRSGAERDVPWPSSLYPFLLVNIGSGVSVLRVSGPESSPLRNHELEARAKIEVEPLFKYSLPARFCKSPGKMLLSSIMS